MVTDTTVDEIETGTETLVEDETAEETIDDEIETETEVEEIAKIEPTNEEKETAALTTTTPTHAPRRR